MQGVRRSDQDPEAARAVAEPIIQVFVGLHGLGVGRSPTGTMAEVLLCRVLLLCWLWRQTL